MPALPSTEQLLALLDAKGVRPRDIASALDVQPSRVSELRAGTRKLQYEESRKLIEVFGLTVLERAPAIRATAMPTHTNPYGGVFGGWIVSQMALGAGSEASRRVRGKAVLVAADELRFTGAPQVGDEVSVYVDLVESGRTSLTYAAEAVARERHGETETRVASGRFKFVALDDDDKPRSVTS